MPFALSRSLRLLISFAAVHIDTRAMLRLGLLAVNDSQLIDNHPSTGCGLDLCTNGGAVKGRSEKAGLAQLPERGKDTP